MNLAALQRDFRGWLVEGSDDAASRIGAAARPGLAVYQNNYRTQLVACLAETYGHTHAWLGDDAFLAAAITHIDASPPHAWTLDAYPEGFAVTLAGLYPDDGEVAELAALEWALSRAFTAPDAAPMTPGDLAAVDWDTAIIRFTPSLDIIPAATNAAAIWSALAAGETPSTAERLPEPAALVVWRQDFAPSFRTIDAVEEQAIIRCAARQDFTALCGSLIETLGESAGIDRAAALLGQWIGDGLIVGAGPD
ncbi:MULTISPECIES: DNA-binding domain-containing protein [unclassified Novosphingobium]|uniref:HvfC/BufC N-terminal domain-containing protein n=1 Tax=unclassified Novosphingobium TaxID=2644732 RepID=UPI001356E045|nr:MULTISPECIES: DNA-binding domain-containing protein [unclassified Novosphingobium]